MFDHIADWHGEAGRCPLFLEELHDFDSTWPAYQERCLQNLHRLVCPKKLELLDLDVLNSSFAPVRRLPCIAEATAQVHCHAASQTRPLPQQPLVHCPECDGAEWRVFDDAAIECRRRSRLVVGAHSSQRLRLFEE